MNIRIKLKTHILIVMLLACTDVICAQSSNRLNFATGFNADMHSESGVMLYALDFSIDNSTYYDDSMVGFSTGYSLKLPVFYSIGNNSSDFPGTFKNAVEIEFSPAVSFLFDPISGSIGPQASFRYMHFKDNTLIAEAYFGIEARLDAAIAVSSAFSLTCGADLDIDFLIVNLMDSDKTGLTAPKIGIRPKIGLMLHRKGTLSIGR